MMPAAFRDQLAEALHRRREFWNPDEIRDILADLMPVIAAEIARVQAAGEQRAAEEMQAFADDLCALDPHIARLAATRAAALAQPEEQAAGEQRAAEELRKLLDVLDAINVGYVPQALRDAMTASRAALAQPEEPTR